MNIDEFEIYQYNLPLAQPLSIKGHPLNSREGLIICLKSQEGKEGFGEIAPLPAFSKETLNDALEQIGHLRSKLTGLDIPDGLGKFNGEFEHWLQSYQLSPSVRFGFECAVLHLLAATRETNRSKLIPSGSYHQVRLSGLLSGPKEGLIAQTNELIDKGFTELKLKVGNDIDDDIEKVLIVNDAAYGKVLLHLDANQQWSYEEALTFGKAIGCAAASYIEEPFTDTKKIPEFYDQTLIPVALDESVNTLTLEEIKAISGVETVVLKPSIIGGVEKIMQMMSEAENYALDTVISSSFESSIGIWALANIVETSSHNTSAGLDTLKWFKHDVLNEPVRIDNGAIDFSKDLLQREDINFNILQKLS